VRLFATTFLLIFLAELADKSRLAGFILSTTFQARAAVFWGMTAGYALLDGFAVWAGGFIAKFVSPVWVNVSAGILFLIFGLMTLIWGEKMESEGRRWIQRFQSWGPFFVSFVTIGLSEMGDRTQIVTAVLSAESRSPLTVYGGAMAALSLLNFLTVWLGARLASALPAKWIHRIAGVLFLAGGLWMIYSSI
jgi:putative Ca2+/H+ antiporter (TMEM165/GDT1 family)